MKWPLFGSSSSPSLRGEEEVPEPDDWRRQGSSPTSSLTAQDVATDTRRFCLDCGAEFQVVPYKKRAYYACKECWRKTNCTGKPPRVAAPHGPDAADGIWEKVRRDSIVSDPKLRRGSKGQAEMKQMPGRSSVSSVSSIPLDRPQTPSSSVAQRHGSKTSVVSSVRRSSKSFSDHPQTPSRGAERRGSTASEAEETSGFLPEVNSMQRRPSPARIGGSEDTHYSSERSGHRSASVPSIRGDDRTRSVEQKLHENRTVQAAMVAIVKDLARSNHSGWELFDQLDLNGDGELSRVEMMQGLRKLGISLPPIELDAVLRAFDVDGNGFIDPTEFTDTISLWLPIVQPIIEAEEAARRAAALAALMPDLKDCALPGGFEVGMQVRSLARLARASGKEEAGPEEGIVIGPGVSTGTILVKFGGRNGSNLSLKPNLLRPMKSTTH